jgi:Holliday junction resolvasome RuvABC ATP-dependent DNA helicase subunit
MLRELFAGRWNQLTNVIDAVGQHGLHVVIYGERGVGKTSLANIVKPTIRAFDEGGSESRFVIKANANIGDVFSSIWEKLFIDLTWADNRPSVGLNPGGRPQLSLREAFHLPDLLRPDDVRRVLTNLPGAVFIIDEFDRAKPTTSRAFTDLIKALSDFSVDCTIIMVGVADAVDKLVADHASINRALIQVHLPRMEAQELEEILIHAETSLAVEFSPEARRLIVNVSQGLPHYTHLIGLNSLRKAALEHLSRRIERKDVFDALKEAVKQAQQTVTERYSKAAHSSHKDALHRQILLGCAVAAGISRDALGFFHAASVVNPLESILGRAVEIATFNNHLAEFCEEKRGCVLERIGRPRSFRYRFQDPLVVPYIFMDALSTQLVDDERLGSMLGATF